MIDLIKVLRKDAHALAKSIDVFYNEGYNMASAQECVLTARMWMHNLKCVLDGSDIDKLYNSIEEIKNNDDISEPKEWIRGKETPLDSEQDICMAHVVAFQTEINNLTQRWVDDVHSFVDKDVFTHKTYSTQAFIYLRLASAHLRTELQTLILNLKDNAETTADAGD